MTVACLVVEHRLYGAQASVVTAHGLGCPVARGILVPRPKVKPVSPASVVDS